MELNYLTLKHKWKIKVRTSKSTFFSLEMKIHMFLRPILLPKVCIYLAHTKTQLKDFKLYVDRSYTAHVDFKDVNLNLNVRNILERK